MKSYLTTVGLFAVAAALSALSCSGKFYACEVTRTCPSTNGGEGGEAGEEDLGTAGSRAAGGNRATAMGGSVEGSGSAEKGGSAGKTDTDDVGGDASFGGENGSGGESGASDPGFVCNASSCALGCCSGTKCLQQVTCLIDADGDGFGDETLEKIKRCGSCLAGEAIDRGVGKNDCYDDPDFSGAQVFPGAPPSASTQPSGYGFDWDCSGLVEIVPPATSGCAEGQCDQNAVYSCGGTEYCKAVYCGKTFPQLLCVKDSGSGLCSTQTGNTVTFKCR